MAGKHQTTTAAHLDALRASGVTDEQMAETFGVHITAVHRWLKRNEAPKWTVAASSAFSSSKKILVVGVIDKDKWATVEPAFTALGLEKIGQRNI